MSTISRFQPSRTGPNFGASTVEIGSPGAGVSKSTEQKESVQLSGTGFAAPIVAGKAAMLLAAQPDLSFAELKEKLASDSQTGVTAGDALRTMSLVAQSTFDGMWAGAGIGPLGAALADPAISLKPDSSKLHTKTLVIDKMPVTSNADLLPEVSTAAVGGALFGAPLAGQNKHHSKMMVLDHMPATPYASVLPEVSTAGLGATLGAWTSNGPITVAVLDSGADASHPDLKGHLAPGSATTDESGSGTHVAGIILGH